MGSTLPALAWCLETHVQFPVLPQTAHIALPTSFSLSVATEGRLVAFPLGKENINRESKSNKESTIFQYLRQIEIHVNVMRSLIF